MEGAERAEFILSALEHKAWDLGVLPDVLPFRTIEIPFRSKGRPFPGDIEMETRITAIIRWNALAMVVRANSVYGELGGHVASYASAAEIFESGSIISSARDGRHDGGDFVFSNPIRPRASTLALSSKGG